MTRDLVLKCVIVAVMFALVATVGYVVDASLTWSLGACWAVAATYVAVAAACLFSWPNERE